MDRFVLPRVLFRFSDKLEIVLREEYQRNAGAERIF